MSKAKIKFTYEDYVQLPEDKRYELMEGEFHMVPSPGWGHQTIVMRIFLALCHYVTSRGLGEVRFAPLDVVLSAEDVLQPDILFISKERSHIITEKNIQGAPDLVIEVLSPATAERDRGLKRKLYAKFGVTEYWTVDPEGKSIEVMSSGEKGFDTVHVYKMSESVSSPLLKGLSFNLGEIF
jgi:Uma2 family endonuclease